MNGSNGYDVMNEANFFDVRLVNSNDALNLYLSDRLQSDRKLDDDFYQVNIARTRTEFVIHLEKTYHYYYIKNLM